MAALAKLCTILKIIFDTFFCFRMYLFNHYIHCVFYCLEYKRYLLLFSSRGTQGFLSSGVNSAYRTSKTLIHVLLLFEGF